MTTPDMQPITEDSPLRDLSWDAVPLGLDIYNQLKRASIRTVGELEVMGDEALRERGVTIPIGRTFGVIDIVSRRSRSRPRSVICPGGTSDGVVWPFGAGCCCGGPT